MSEWPTFGRDGDGVAWRPTAELLEASQLDDPGTLEAIRAITTAHNGDTA